MRVFSKPALRAFGEKQPDAMEPLLAWYRAALRADRGSIVDVRREFPHADFADLHTIFNIGGNKYRLSAVIYYACRRVYIKAIQTHAEYSRSN